MGSAPSARPAFCTCSRSRTDSTQAPWKALFPAVELSDAASPRSACAACSLGPAHPQGPGRRGLLLRHRPAGHGRSAPAEESRAGRHLARHRGAAAPTLSTRATSPATSRQGGLAPDQSGPADRRPTSRATSQVRRSATTTAASPCAACRRPSGGIAVAQMLGILETKRHACAGAGRRQVPGAEAVHLFSEAGRLAYADRNRSRPTPISFRCQAAASRACSIKPTSPNAPR